MRRSTIPSLLVVAAALIASQPALAQSSYEELSGYPCSVGYSKVDQTLTDFIEVTLYSQPHCAGWFEGKAYFFSVGALPSYGIPHSNEELLAHFERLHEAALHGGAVKLGITSWLGVVYSDFYASD